MNHIFIRFFVLFWFKSFDVCIFFWSVLCSFVEIHYTLQITQTQNTAKHHKTRQNTKTKHRKTLFF